MSDKYAKLDHQDAYHLAVAKIQSLRDQIQTPFDLPPFDIKRFRCVYGEFEDLLIRMNEIEASAAAERRDLP